MAQEPWRQGDILFIESVQNDPLPLMGLIINADCDLANEKTDGVIAYLPIYSFREYLEIFWTPKYLNTYAETTIKKILTLIKADDTEADNLLSWISHSEAENIIAKLSSLNSLKPTQVEEIKSCIYKLQICIDTSLPPLIRLCHLCKKEKDPDKALKKQLSGAKNAMGNDHFFINDMVGQEDVGFVIRMRRIYTILKKHCFTSKAEQGSSSDGKTTTAVRVARLMPLYQFKVAQIFAQQYSRIGLPDEITAMCDVAIEIVTSSLLQET